MIYLLTAFNTKICDVGLCKDTIVYERHFEGGTTEKSHAGKQITFKTAIKKKSISLEKISPPFPSTRDRNNDKKLVP
jgi:hypothetical protein